MINDLACVEFVEQLTELLDDALDRSARQRLTAHLTDCDGCEQYLRQFRQSIAALRSLPAEPADAFDAAGQLTLLDAYRDATRS